MKKKNVLNELMLLRVSGVNLADVANLISQDIYVDGKNIRRVYEAEGNNVLVQVRNTDERKPGEVINLLSEKFGADKVVKVYSTIPGF
jgi:hypothetical protein